MLIKLTKAALDWFDEMNISFHSQFGVRLRPGDHLWFRDDVEVEPYVGFHGGNAICAMGFMSFTNSNVPLHIRIGRYCSLALNLRFPQHRHPIEHISTSIFTHAREADPVVRYTRAERPDYANFYPNPQKGSIVIEHDVWIGQEVAIMPGLTIGTGSVIAANSVVTKPVLPYQIVGGNPAKLIKMRFPAELIERLLGSEWWKYKFTDFDGLDVSDPIKFLDGFEERKVNLTEYQPNKVRIANVAKLCTG